MCQQAIKVSTTSACLGEAEHPIRPHQHDEGEAIHRFAFLPGKYPRQAFKPKSINTWPR